MDKNEDKYEIGDNLDNLVTEYEEELKKTYDSLSLFFDKSVELKLLSPEEIAGIRKESQDKAKKTISKSLEFLKKLDDVQIKEIIQDLHSENGKDELKIRIEYISKIHKLFDDMISAIEKGDTEPPSSAISELKKIAKSKKSSQIQVSKDIWKAQINSVGDTLAYVEDESQKNHIRDLQKRGKLLAGTLEGLSGGSAQLKVFTIALARTLNEQSKYYKTEEDWSGVPKNLIPAIMGEDVEIEKKDPVIGKEKRPYPYILVSYEDMAKKMSKTGKIAGGKYTEYIKDYIEELSGKEYLLDSGNQIVGIRFLNKLMTIYTKDRGTEIGCLLQLSPQFSKSMGGYTGLRSDTIQLLGGGKQKDITMDLFDLLIYYRGIPGGVYRVSKKELLSRYESKPTYMSGKAIRRTKLKNDFQTAIEKIKDAKVITEYKEERIPGGEVVSVFYFTKEEYLVGDEIEEQ